MSQIVVERQIAAPVERVFATISDVRNFSKAVPDIVNIEFLTESKSGTGTRFRETRNMNGREATVELEVAEYEENRRVRMVSDAGGTVWDTVFEVQPLGDQTQLTMTMDARPYRLVARVMNLLIGGIIRRAVEKDMDAVKEYCEGAAS